MVIRAKIKKKITFETQATHATHSFYITQMSFTILSYFFNETYIQSYIPRRIICVLIVNACYVA